MTTINVLNNNLPYYGTYGNDTFNVSSGSHNLYGLGANDTVSYSSLKQGITMKPFGEVDKGGLGKDTMHDIKKIVASNTANDTINASTSSAGIVANLTTKTLTIPAAGLAFAVVQFENVFGSNLKNDSITGDDFANSLNGNGGNDYLVGNGGNDSLNGGADNDYLDGGIGNDSLNGGTGNDYLLGNSGNDTLLGSRGNDNLVGGAGADKFVFTNFFGDTSIIQDFTIAQRDKIQISLIGFGATSVSQFTYSAGNLSFKGDTFVTLLNAPSNFNISSSVNFV